MKERHLIDRRPHLIASALCLAVSLAPGAAAWRSGAQSPAPEAAGGQRPEGEKVLKKSSHPDEPVRIVKVRNKKGDLRLGRKFRDEANAGWLRGLTITVENTSGRTITHLGFTLLFPGDVNLSTNERSYGFDLRFGVSPQDPHYGESRRRQPDRIVRHGERLDLTLTDEDYEHIQRVLRTLGYPPDLREVEMWLNEVGFDDGSWWPGGGPYDQGGSQQLKKPPRGRGTAKHSFINTSHPAIKSVPVQSRCGGDVHRFFTDTCSLPQCLRPQDRVDYSHPSNHRFQEFLRDRDCLRFDSARNGYVVCADPTLGQGWDRRPCCPMPKVPNQFGQCVCPPEVPDCDSGGGGIPDVCSGEGTLGGGGFQPAEDGGASTPDGVYCTSPVLVDVAGDGFRLTDAAGGVRFDLNGNGEVEGVLAWTAAGSDDAWLALDRDGDGRVTTGRELFGNFTAQPAPPPGEERNGFLALAEFDRPPQGGNSDGAVDAADAVFARLRLWRDANHDGVSGPGELHTLPSQGVARLHLNYKESKREDEHGNRFRYRAKADGARGAEAGRWAWDVFLLTGP